MSGRVLSPPRMARREGLQVGGHYRLPSGRTVKLTGLAKGGVALCRYIHASGSGVARDDEVSLVAAWLERHGQLNWGG
jgi:hypothetical protein